MGKKLSVIESSQIEWVPVDSLQKKNGKQMVQSEEFHLFPAFFNFLSSDTAHADNSKPAVPS